MTINRNISKWLKSNRGFTLIEIICVVILLGIISAIGVHLMKGTSTSGRTNALGENAYELNNAIQSLVATGATFSAGAYGVTAGTATTAAAITLPAAPAAADVGSLITSLTGAGILSYNMTLTLTHSMTAASYTWTLDGTTHVPTITVVGGATQP